MSIKRYYATADNTITNAFDETLGGNSRGTGSNMGAADILEVFSIYGQQTTSSSELTRILIQFDIDGINSDRTAGKIPTAGNVKFFLNLYNAKHALTLPENYDLTISAVSQSWQEGNGLDMENYSDKTYGLSGSNWTNAGHEHKAEATIVISDAGGILGGDTFTLVDSLGASTVYTINGGVAQGSGGGSGGSATVGFLGVGGGTGGKIAAASAMVTAINATTDANYSAVSNGVDTVTITQGTVGIVGNKENSDSISSTVVSNFAGGGGPWISAGGDYHASPTFNANFYEGCEDLSVDVTTLVEEWIAGTKQNYGFGIKLKDNLEVDTKSYYTKKFFARGTEFFFKKPSLEARWDDSIQDDRGYFYASSSLAPANDNLNTLYLYNRIRGRLRNIPAVGIEPIRVSLYTSAGGTQIGSTFTGSHVSTGIYKCDVFAETTSTSIIDVWHSGGVEYHTGSIEINQETAEIINENERYLITIPNLNKVYFKDDIARFKVFVRPKRWSPTVYTVAKATPEATSVVSASYEIYRVVDNLKIISHDTGSNLTTRLSYNVSGNYFDLDMSCFETGYDYGIRFAFYDDYLSNWNHQPYEFIFKVREDEY
jgi:hypothetical protein